MASRLLAAASSSSSSSPLARLISSRRLAGAAGMLGSENAPRLLPFSDPRIAHTDRSDPPVVRRPSPVVDPDSVMQLVVHEGDIGRLGGACCPPEIRAHFPL